jgi:hypothetical protein
MNIMNLWSDHTSNSPTRGKVIKFDDGRFVIGREKSEVPNLQFIVIGHAEGWRFLKAGAKPAWVMREAGEDKPMAPEVPEDEFITDLSGQRVSPWRYVRYLYLVDAGSGTIYTFETASTGGAMSIAELGEQVAGMRELRGHAEAVPVVELRAQAFKTKFGVKKRPEFAIVGWKGGEQDKPLGIAGPVGVSDEPWVEDLADGAA